MNQIIGVAIFIIVMTVLGFCILKTAEADDSEPPSNEGNVVIYAMSPHYIEKPKTSAIVLPKNCGDNWYANYIYFRESGCDVAAVNPSSGAYGIGQALPASKLPCGHDYECQNNWFNKYAIERYGSWKTAYEFWTVNRWW